MEVPSGELSTCVFVRDFENVSWDTSWIMVVAIGKESHHWQMGPPNKPATDVP